MADEDVELVGGIAVSVGASHRQLVTDLQAADRILEAWAQRSVKINIGAQVTTPQPVRQTPATPVSFGPGAATRAQAQQGQTALQRAINAELGKTGEMLDENGEIVSQTTSRIRGQKNAIIEVQQAAATQTPLALGTDEVQKGLDEILASLREIVETAKTMGSIPAPVATGGSRGGARRATPVRSASADEGEEEYGADFPRIRYLRSAPGSRDAESLRLDVNRSEQALNRQRRREEERSARDRRQREDAEARVRQENDRRSSTSTLEQLTAEAQADNAREEYIGARPFAPGERERQERERAEAAQRASTSRARTPRTTPAPAPAVVTPQPDAIERERRRLLSLIGSRGGRGAGLGGQSEEDILAREEQRVATQRAQAVAAGRTARTQASSLGGLLSGRGGLIEAQARLAAANERVRLTQRNLFDPEVIRDARAYKVAVGDAAAADKERAAALKKVESFSGFGAAAKSLIGVTVAGAAFGLGLKAIDVGLELTGRALQPVIDRALGFSNVAGRVTDQLSDQTREAKGNVQAVVALANAQAGLSKSSAAIISPLISQQAAIEAGNKALGDAVDQFQTYQKLRSQGVGGITSQTGGFLGTGFFGTRSTSQELGRLFQGLPRGFTEGAGAITQTGGRGPRGALGPTLTAAQAETNLSVFNDGLKFANEQLVKGGDVVDKFVNNLSDPDLQKSLDAFARAGADSSLIDALRSQRIGVQGIDAAGARRILEAFNAGAQQQDPQLLATQLARQNAALVSQLGKEIKFQTQTQLPVQNALQGLANPNVAVGTGLTPEDRQRVTGTLSEANDLQAQLNARYDAGRAAVEATYRPAIVKNFGAAAAKAFDSALASVINTGQQIASIQEGISNEQADYQTAQYNFQLQIAKRTLSDIAGLNDRNYGVGQSQLGQLERSNLLLGRQAQMFQFELSQRQINYQTAVAGFSAPGVTPEERQANVKAAQIEAEYAQKQLDIQKQMFGNQVQIVDIQNLRQGVDLVNQIGLLQQGRQVQIDTTAAEQKLIRLNQLQAQNVQQVGTYIDAVNTLVSTAFGQIASLEAAAGAAMGGLAVGVLTQFGLVIGGITQSVGALTGTTRYGGKMDNPKLFASGSVQNIGTPTRIGENGLMGEAGDETLLILSRPRVGAGGGGTGGGIVVYVYNPVVRNDSDIDALARRVAQELGQQAATLGLRTIG